MLKYIRNGNKVDVYKVNDFALNSPCCGENRTEWIKFDTLGIKQVPTSVFFQLLNRNIVFD